MKPGGRYRQARHGSFGAWAAGAGDGSDRQQWLEKTRGGPMGAPARPGLDPRCTSRKRPIAVPAARGASPAPQSGRPIFPERSQCQPTCGKRRNHAAAFTPGCSIPPLSPVVPLSRPVFGKSSFRGRPPHPIADLSLTRSLTPWPLSRCSGFVQQQFSPGPHPTRQAAWGPWDSGPFLAIATRQNSRAPKRRGVDRRQPAAPDGALSRPQGAASASKGTRHADHRLFPPGRPLRPGRYSRNPDAQGQDQVRAAARPQREAAGLVADLEERRRISLPQARRSEPARPGVLQPLQERERSRRPLGPLIGMAPAQAGASPASRRVYTFPRSSRHLTDTNVRARSSHSRHRSRADRSTSFWSAAAPAVPSICAVRSVTCPQAHSIWTRSPAPRSAIRAA